MARLQIEVRRRGLWPLMGVLAMGSLWFVGWSASPRVDDRPQVLTPARRELLAYLGQAKSWAAALEMIQGSLLGLLPEAARPLDGDLATPRPPFGHPELLRDRALAADNAYTHLLALRAQLERTEAPSVMTGLHAAAGRAVSDHLRLAQALLDYLGAPATVKETALRDLAASAREALAAFRSVLDAQAWE